MVNFSESYLLSVDLTGLLCGTCSLWAAVLTFCCCQWQLHVLIICTWYSTSTLSCLPLLDYQGKNHCEFYNSPLTKCWFLHEPTYSHCRVFLGTFVVLSTARSVIIPSGYSLWYTGYIFCQSTTTCKRCGFPLTSSIRVVIGLPDCYAVYCNGRVVFRHS